MTVFRAVLQGVAAVHIFVAMMYGVVALRRRRGGEFLSFSVLSLALAGYSYAGVLVLDAQSEYAVAEAMNLKLITIAMAAAAFVGFAHILMERSDDRWVIIASMICAGFIGLALAGFFIDGGVAEPRSAGALDQVLFSWWVGVFATLSGGAGVVTTRRLFRHEAHRDELRLLAWSGAVTLPAFFYDVVRGVFGLGGPSTLETASVLDSVLVSWLLLRRFVREGAALAERTEELRHAYEELDLMQDELLRKEQLATVGELSAVIAHEVRNPLAVLKNAVTGLRRDGLDADAQKTLLHILNEESDRLNRLVGDLLAYARPVAPQFHPVHLRELIDDTVERVSLATPHAEHVTVNTAIDFDGTIEADRDLLQRVLVNIVDNAMQAMPNGGELSIAVSQTRLGESDAVHIAVSDTGEGMDTLVRARANEPFFTTRSTGTGLGLAIVHRIVGAHGGHVRYLSPRDELGTTVRVFMPLAQSADAEPLISQTGATRARSERPPR